MRVVEVRDLDWPNLFLLAPAIKLELADDPGDDHPAEFAASVIEACRALHRAAGHEPPQVVWRELESPGHRALAFGWSRRRFALRVADLVGRIATGGPFDLAAAGLELTAILAEAPDRDDAPQLVRDAERSVPIVGVTGTNGKTTTTRLIAHVLRQSGQKVGWSSSSGVYIEGEEVLRGDYTGPGGARRVLEEPGIDVAVLETARGGILLRGIAYESNDVGVMINISEDHLGLHGINTVAGLLATKATVVKVTRSTGTVVLNADDALVASLVDQVAAPVLFVSRRDDNPVVLTHTSGGGRALVVRDGIALEHHRGTERPLVDLADVPITHGGKAPHMVENALCAAGACLGLGLSAADVAEGLRTFRNSPDQNFGRLNVYDVGGRTVIVDYAHNEAGLENLLALAGALRGDGGRLISIIGTAGDRRDDALRELGRIAAATSDEVVIKETTKYLRGRTAEEMNRLLGEGATAGGKTPRRYEPGEIEAMAGVLNETTAGDVVAMMCIEDLEDVRRLLLERGTLTS